MEFDRKVYADMFKKALAGERIKKSQETFKIKLFLAKAENSLLIAKYVKDIKPAKDQHTKINANHFIVSKNKLMGLYFLF